MGKGKKKGLARLHDLFRYNLRGTRCGRCGHEMQVSSERMWKEMKSIFKAAVNDEIKEREHGETAAS